MPTPDPAEHYRGETRCPFPSCTHQPGEFLAGHLAERHGKEGIAYQLAAATERIRQMNRALYGPAE